jgi:hypothetical protein
MGLSEIKPMLDEYMSRSKIHGGASKGNFKSFSGILGEDQQKQNNAPQPVGIGATSQRGNSMGQSKNHNAGVALNAQNVGSNNKNNGFGSDGGILDRAVTASKNIVDNLEDSNLYMLRDLKRDLELESINNMQ